MELKLNLGCSDSLLPGYVNVDCVPLEKLNADMALGADRLPDVYGNIRIQANNPMDAITLYRRVNLEHTFPWGGGTVDYILAEDIIEHLPDKIHTMNEIWRVLKPGGVVNIFVPTTDGRGADQDPEHVSRWNPNSFFYHVRCFPEWIRFGPMKGYMPFDIEGCSTREQARQALKDGHKDWGDGVYKLRVKLVKVVL